MQPHVLFPPTLPSSPFPKWIAAPARHSAIHLLLGARGARARSSSWKEAEQNGWCREFPPAEVRQARAKPEGYALILRTDAIPARIVVIGDTPRALQYGKVTADQLLRLNPTDRRPDTLVVGRLAGRPHPRRQPHADLQSPRRARLLLRGGPPRWQDVFRRMVDLKLNTFFIHSGWGEGIRALIDARGRRQPFVDQLVRTATGLNLEVAGLVVHSLEIGGRAQSYGTTYPDLTRPGNRRLVFRTFRRLVRAYPEIRYWIVHNEEHRRGPGRISFAQEFFGFVRTFRQILRQRTRAPSSRSARTTSSVFHTFTCATWTAATASCPPTCERLVDGQLPATIPAPVPQRVPGVPGGLRLRPPAARVALVLHERVDGLAFPCPAHFRSWIQNGMRSGHVEAYAGETPSTAATNGTAARWPSSPGTAT